MPSPASQTLGYKLTMTISMKRINSLVLDYLVVNGLREVAENFVVESGLPPVDLDDIERRRVVSELLLKGQVEAAIDAIADLDSYFLDSNTEVYFLLLELYMVELAREALPEIDADPSCASPLLDFAQQRVLPFVNEHCGAVKKQYVERLEGVLALVCFPLPEPAPAILDYSHRQAVARSVNAALLESRGQPGTSKLTRAIKTYSYTELAVPQP